MRVTGPHSDDFDAARVVDSDHKGQVAWDQFNPSYERLQTVPWREINQGRSYRLPYRAIRALMLWFIHRTDGILDLAGKAKILSRFNIPRDPNIVFFGAEVGWEAALVQSLFGDGGRVVLIDSDPTAYARFRNAPLERTIKAPRGWPTKRLVLRRTPDTIEYVQGDFFEFEEREAFDVGIDWGLLEHFSDPRKIEVMAAFQRCLRPSGVQITAVPRNTMAVRSFYWAFRDELNFGYRELMNMDEFAGQLERGGYVVQQRVSTPTTCLALCSRADVAGE